MSEFFGTAFRKFFELLLSLWFLVTLNFVFLRLLPGGPFDDEIHLHPLVKAQLEKSWHLQAPLFDQYLHYLSSLLQGDMGTSMIRPDRSVLQILQQGFGQTFLLNLFALVFIYLGAFVLVVLWARFRRGFIGGLIDQVFIALISLPSLFLAPLLIYLFGFWLNILPTAFLTSPVHFILPLLALGLRPMAYVGRILQRSVLEQLASDYVRTAMAKGLGRVAILRRHVLRNSLVPVLSYSGTLLVSLLSGSFLIEVLFAIPGLGSEFVNSLAERDYTVICGLALFYGAILIVTNLFFDFLMRQTDPRLKRDA